jgi:hypothetical protein
MLGMSIFLPLNDMQELLEALQDIIDSSDIEERIENLMRISSSIEHQIIPIEGWRYYNA